MSAQVLDNVNTTPHLRIRQTFAWTNLRGEAALVLAEGGSKQEAADRAGVSRTTIYEWLQYPEFCAEIDRLSVMVGIASRAERLRVAMRLVRSRINEETGAVQSDKDVLDWLKFAQSETDGAKIDLSKLAELLSGEQQEPQVKSVQQLATGAIEVEVSQSTSSSQLDELDFNPS